jgi:hypothetical protein
MTEAALERHLFTRDQYERMVAADILEPLSAAGRTIEVSNLLP